MQRRIPRTVKPREWRGIQQSRRLKSQIEAGGYWVPAFAGTTSTQNLIIPLRVSVASVDSRGALVKVNTVLKSA